MGRQFILYLGKPETSQRIDAFLATVVPAIPAWRIPLLLQHKVIVVEHNNGKEDTPTDPGYMVDSRDAISQLEPPPDSYTRAVEKLPASAFRDYGFVPGETGFDVGMRKTLEAYPEMTVITGNIPTLKAFVTILRAKATAPIRDIYLGGHASDYGNLVIPPDTGVTSIEYEDLEEAVRKGTFRIPSEMLHPRPLDANKKPIPATVHIKGCQVGRQIPFLAKMKEAFGPEVDRVTAPKFYQAAGGLKHPEGRTEYMMYEFLVSRQKKFTDRIQVVKAFEAGGFTHFDGKPVDKKSWGKWVGKAFDTRYEDTERITVRHRLQGSPGGEVVCQYVTRSFLLGPYSMKSDRAPTSDSDFRTMLEGELPRRQARFKSDHPSPYYQRYGYKTLREMLEGFGWDYNWKKDGNSGKISFTGTRYDYLIRAPVVDGPHLLLNWYPTGASLAAGRVPFIEIPESDTRFFGVA